MHYSTGRLVLSKRLVNWCCFALLLSNTLLAIHPTADCWDVPREHPTFVLQFLFWEIAATHYSVICIFKVFLHVIFLQTGLYLSFYHSVMQCCEWFLQPASTSANFGIFGFQPPFHTNDSAEQHRHQHQSPQSSTGKYSPLWTWILYFYPFFPTFKDFTSANL